MIKSITLSNIRSFKEKQINFGEGIVVIMGKNGSGKSTILSSISYAITDYLDMPLGYFRSIESPPTEDSIVELSVDNLLIKKRISPKKGKLSVSMEILNGNEIVNVSNVTMAKQYILNVLNIQPYLFLNSIYISQTGEIDLLTKPSTAKSFLIKLYNLNEYDDLSKKAKEVIDILQIDIGKVEGKVAGIIACINNKDIPDLDVVNNKIRELESRYIETKNQLSELNSLIESHKPLYKEAIQAQAKRKELNIKIIYLNKKLGELPTYDNTDAIRENMSLLVTLQADCNKEITKYNSLLDYWSRLLSVVIENKCPTCYKELSTEDIKDIKTRITDSIHDIEYRLATGIPLLKSIENNIEEINKQYNYVSTIFLKRETIKDNLLFSQQQLESIENINTSIIEDYEGIFSRLDIVNKECMRIQGELATEENIKREIIKYQSSLKNIKELETKRGNNLFRVDTLSTLRDAYGKDGIPKYIIENQLGLLEATINDNLAVLSDDNMELSIITSTEDRDILDILVTRNNYTKPFSALSKGEKKRVILACAFGIGDAFQLPLKWRLLDEADENLDEAGILSLREFFTINKHKYDQIIMASIRPELMDIATQVITLNAGEDSF